MRTPPVPLTLLVLAAGRGSRFGGLKQLAPVNDAGETILHYSVYDAVRAGFSKVVFVIRKEMEQVFRESISFRCDRDVEVAYAFQELSCVPSDFAAPHGRIKPWGTLHATLIGADLIDGPFAVINADDFYSAESYGVLAQHLQYGSPNGAMVGFPLRNTLSDFGPVSRGVCRVDAEGFLLSTVEMTKIVRDGPFALSLEGEGSGARLSGDEIASMNMWGFTPSTREHLRQSFRDFLEASGSDLKAESYLPDAVNRIVSGGMERLKVLRTDGVWFGITYPQDYPHVVQNIRDLTRNGRYPERLWS